MRILKSLRYALFLVILTQNFVLFSQKLKKKPIKYNYLLYSPKEIKIDSSQIPLVIYLHGASCKGSNINHVKKYGLPYYVNKGIHYNFYIASPQCPSNKSWLSENWFEPLYNELISKYPIDKNRVYVVGMSMGGYGAWHLAMEYPDKIAGLVALCGGCYDSINICKINKIPVWAIHGALDKIIPIDETEKLVYKLLACNATVKYTRVEDRGHNIANYFGRNEIYEWLLEQRKEEIILPLIQTKSQN
jgi:predicted peptidase